MHGGLHGGMGGMGGMNGMPGWMPAGFSSFGGGMFTGVGGGAHHMSQEEAHQFFSQAFGGNDPFGGMFGGGGGQQGMSFGGGGGGQPGMADPFQSMFHSQQNGGAPGGMGMSQMCGMGMPGGMGGMPGMGGGFAPNNGAAGGQASRQPTPTPAPQAYDVIPPGTIVSLKGLVKASHHNGDRGVIRKYAQSNGRYVVELEDPDDDDVETMAVKPENLLQHVHVRIHDIVSQPELNGRVGTIITWAPSKAR